MTIQPLPALHVIIHVMNVIMPSIIHAPIAHLQTILEFRVKILVFVTFVNMKFMGRASV